MLPLDDYHDLPILYIYDLDTEWSSFEINRVIGKTEFMIASLQELGHFVKPVRISDKNIKSQLMLFDPKDYVVFNVCEELPGVPRSAAQVTQVLEELGFTHTGSSSVVLDFIQNKQNMKRSLEHFGIPTPDWNIYSSWSALSGENPVNGWSCFPAIVKPVMEHCSVGISSDSVVTTLGELQARIDYITETFGQPALVEDFIEGREFRVAILGNDDVEILPPAEIDYSFFSDIKDRLLSFASKMDPDSICYHKIQPKIPTNLTQDELAQIEHIAKDVYRAFDCRDYSAIDIRQRDEKFYVLDMNPDPEISPECSFALAAYSRGYSYGQLGSRIINLAARRHPIFSRQRLIQMQNSV